MGPNHPLRFNGKDGQIQAGLQFDAPITRVAERNAYREALINYEQSRRAYYNYTDRVSESLLTSLRRRGWPR